MALLTNTQKVATACTAASGAANKTSALVTGIMDAVFAELGKTASFTPNQQNKLALMRANAVTNMTTLQTAIGL